jgi:hypothetical protein
MQRIGRQWNCVAIVAAALVWWLVASQAEIKQAPEFVDERGWATAALVHGELLINGRMAPQDWTQEKYGVYGNLNPQLGKLMLGLAGQLCSAITGLRDPSPARLWALPFAIEGKSPLRDYAPGFFYRYRSIARFCAGLTALSAIVIAWKMFGGPTAAVYSIILLSNGFFMRNAVRILTDQHYVLFMNGALLSGMAFTLARTRRARVLSIVALSVCAGAASSVKVTGGAVILLFVCTLLALKLWRGLISLPGAIKAVILYLCVSFFVVVALNPFLWPDVQVLLGGASAGAPSDTAGRPPVTPAEWGAMLSDPALDRDWIASEYPKAYAALRPLEFVLMFPRWNRFLRDPSGVLEAPGALAVLGGITTRFSPTPIWGGLLFLGVALAVARNRDDLCTPAIAGICYVVTYYVFLALTLPVDNIARYYLPAFVVVQVFAAYGIVVLAQQCLSVMRVAALQENGGTMESPADLLKRFVKSVFGPRFPPAGA